MSRTYILGTLLDDHGDRIIVSLIVCSPSMYNWTSHFDCYHAAILKIYEAIPMLFALAFNIFFLASFTEWKGCISSLRLRLGLTYIWPLEVTFSWREFFAGWSFLLYQVFDVAHCKIFSHLIIFLQNSVYCNE